MRSRERMRTRSAWYLVPTVCLALAAGACGSSSSPAGGNGGSAASSSTNDLGTLQPGVIKVAVEPYMPYSGKVADQFEGLDIDLLKHAAAALHQKLEFTLTDLAGTIAATTTHKVDMTLGSLTWTTARAKVGRFTDPIYYSPPAALVKQGTKLASLSDFAGKTIGVETGSNFAEAIDKVPGVKPKDYAGVAQGLLDLQSGRIDAYLTDPLVAAYAAKQSATKGLVLAYYKPPSPAQLKAQPLYSNFAPYQVAMYLNKGESRLEKALNKQIDAFYRNGVLANAIKRWGGDPADFTKANPTFTSQRVGVDRAAGWTAPTGG